MEGVNSRQWRATRQFLRETYRNRCAYCFVHTGKGGTEDHYIPRALGGTNARSNLRWACADCNNLKADMHPSEWEKVKPPPVVEPYSKEERKRAAFAKMAAARKALDEAAKAAIIRPVGADGLSGSGKAPGC